MQIVSGSQHQATADDRIKLTPPVYAEGDKAAVPEASNLTLETTSKR